MKLSALSYDELDRAMARGELYLSLPPFVVKLRSDVPELVHDVHAIYADFSCLPECEFADFHIEICLGRGWERWIRPTAYFHFDGMPFFTPLPAYQAFAMLEWGLNWCIAAHSHQYLIFHAAVIERGGRAAVLPAPPGSGKSTLCAALVHRGWRLLSDELALYDIARGEMFGMARPINLKNQSIDVLRSFHASVQMTRPVPNTTKGTVALMRPPSESVARVLESARPAWVISPRFRPGAALELDVMKQADAFMLLAEQSFNYEMHGLDGFNSLAGMIDRCSSYQLTYSSLDEAVTAFEGLLASGSE